PGLGHESIHLDDYPVADDSVIDTRLTDVTRLAMRLSSMGRAARSKASIKVRQPLATAMIKTRSAEERSLLKQAGPQVIDELNVRDIVAFDADSEVVNFKLQANMPILGPKYGMELHNIIEALGNADAQAVAAKVDAGEGVELEGYELEPEEILVSSEERDGFAVSSDAGYTVAIATEITPDLRLEGQARELVHRIQNMRRSAEFDIADRIITYYQGDANLSEVVQAHAEYIRQETLSDELLDASAPTDAYSEDQNFDGIEASIGLVRKA
ncbi:MAG: DUF5915 domain-containing protein, partial [SAR202 cluster bacterium]|nr:DUF5915 domain-containing protein [SAR202 cluster bacterium]